MKVLVTGADGFIGSHLCEKLVELGYEVTALCQYNSFGHFGWLTYSAERNQIKLVIGDIRDHILVSEICKNIEVVINMAALIGIPYSYKAPISYTNTNIVGTQNLCDASLKNKVRHFIQISTSEVYGSALYAPIDEQHPLQPQSPYSASKIGSDAIASSYGYSFGLPVTIARPFNTFGPRQSRRAVIPTLISQLLDPSTKKVRVGNMNTVRDFNYVNDTVKRIITLLSKENNFNQVYNLGGSGAFSIQDVYVKLKNHLKIDKELEITQSKIRPDKSEVLKLVCDSSKFDKEFKKLIPTPFNQALSETCEWFEKNMDSFLNNLNNNEE